MSLLEDNNTTKRITGPQNEEHTSDEEAIVYKKGDVVCDWAWAGNAKRPPSSSSSNRGDEVIPSGGNKEQQNEGESAGADHSCTTSDEESEDYDTIDDHVLTDLEEEEEFSHKGNGKFAAEESFLHQLNKSSEDKWESLLTNENAASYHDDEVNNDTISIQDTIPISMETTKQTNIVQEEEEETESEESCADSSYCSSKIRLNTATMEGKMPSSFLFPKAASSSSSHYLDLKFSTAEISAHSFAMEHRLFLRGIMELLKERDLVGVPANVDDPMYIKAGFLKEKQSTDVFWKLKYVELRKGILTFYTPSDPSLKRRKFIPLRASLCVTCRAVKSAPPSVAKYTTRGGSRTTSTFVFELSVQGHPRRFWMAASNEERLSWIRAIHGATIGGSISNTKPLCKSSSVKCDHFLRRDTNVSYKHDFERFLKVQAQIQSATSKESFVDAMSSLWGSSLTLPVLWIKVHQEQQQSVAIASKSTSVLTEDDNNHNIEEQQQNADLDEGNFISDDAAVNTDFLFWKDLKKVSVSINGFVVKGKSGWGPERIVGALTRCILELDRSVLVKAQPQENRNATVPMNHRLPDSARITEVQAISFARDLLLACNFRRTDAACLYCVETLCHKPELLTLSSPASLLKDPVITINIRCVDKKDGYGSPHNRSGWISSRSSSKKPWKSRFCVLSDGVMSCYEKEHPAPHGLVEQIDLSGATIGVSEVESSRRNLAALNSSRNSSISVNSSSAINKKYLVCVSTKDRSKERQMCFHDREDFGCWQESLHSASSSVVVQGGCNEAAISVGPPSSPKMELRQKLLGTLRRSRASQSREHNSSAASPSNASSIAADDNSFYKESQQRKLVKGFGSLNENNAVGRDNIHPGGVAASQSTLEADVQSSAVFEIRAKLPSGDDRKDIWGMARVQLMQTFILSGGPNGHIQCVDETVKIFLQGHRSNINMSDSVISQETI